MSQNRNSGSSGMKFQMEIKKKKKEYSQKNMNKIPENQ